ncbi:MAG: cellulose biosynthesis protein BcsS [Proteobacteria bacterium]|nr:cellulose biosynthesis protein BcsS [Pseudomonadota bacterium]MBU1641618.1 cellulose biosynthesis protein BcsS [Pseudomonadota bacterium]
MPTKKLSFIGAVIGLLAGTPFLALADQTSEVQILGGLEVSKDTSYAYLGWVAPLPGSQLGNGLVYRLWTDWTNYAYEKDNVTYDARVPGAEVALGYQKAQKDYWWAAYGGPTYHHTHFSPQDTKSNAQGGKLRAKLQLEGEHTLKLHWQLGGIASYILGQEAYWTRVRFARVLASGKLLGLEAITLGDPDYKIHQIGAFVGGLKLSENMNTGVKLGARKIEGLSLDPYLGVELEYRF